MGQGCRLGPGCGGRGAGPRSAVQPPASLFHPETATTGTPPRGTRLCTDPEAGGSGGPAGAASCPVGRNGAPTTEYGVEAPPQIPSRRACGPAAAARGRLRGRGGGVGAGRGVAAFVFWKPPPRPSTGEGTLARWCGCALRGDGGDPGDGDNVRGAEDILQKRVSQALKGRCRLVLL